MRLFAPTSTSQLDQLHLLSSRISQPSKNPLYTEDSIPALTALLTKAFPSSAISITRSLLPNSKSHQKNDFQRFIALFLPSSHFGQALMQFHSVPSPLLTSFSPDQLAYLTTCSELQLKRQNQVYTLPLLQLWATTLALTLLEREKDFPTTWYEALGVDRLAQQLHAQPTPNLIRRWTTHLSRNAPHLLFPFLSALEALLLKEPLNKLKGNLRHWTVRPIHLMSAYLLGVREGSQASLELVVGVGEWMESRERVSFYLFSLWVRVWSGMMTSCSQWEGQLQTALESGQSPQNFSWRPREMIDQLTVDKHWKRLFCSLMRLSLSLCKKMESTVHPELAAALARLLLLETANSDSPLPNSPFASQLQDQIYHIKHSQAREIATNAIAIYEERGGQLEQRKERVMEGGQGLRRQSEVREKNGWAIPIRENQSPLLYLIGIQLAKKIDWLRGQGDGELPFTQMRWICKKRYYSWMVLLLLLLYFII